LEKRTVGRFAKTGPAGPLTRAQPSLKKPGAFSRARPAKARPATPRAPPRGRLRSGQSNLGPGRAFPSPPGPKAAHSSAGRREPPDQDRRLRVDLGRSKPPSPALPETLAPFPLFSPTPPSSPLTRARASDRRAAAAAVAAPWRARSPARASTAGWARRRRAASLWCPASGPKTARASSVLAGPKASRAIWSATVGRVRRRWAAQEVPGK
jgi:hypothetical protein